MFVLSTKKMKIKIKRKVKAKDMREGKEGRMYLIQSNLDVALRVN